MTVLWIFKHIAGLTLNDDFAYVTYTTLFILVCV